MTVIFVYPLKFIYIYILSPLIFFLTQSLFKEHGFSVIYVFKSCFEKQCLKAETHNYFFAKACVFKVKTRNQEV